MSTREFQIAIDGGDGAVSGRYVSELLSALRNVDPSVEATRKRSDPDTMDVGTIIQVVVASQAVALLAAGIADWLRMRNNARVTITKDGIVAENVSPEQVIKIISVKAGEK